MNGSHLWRCACPCCDECRSSECKGSSHCHTQQSQQCSRFLHSCSAHRFHDAQRGSDVQQAGKISMAPTGQPKQLSSYHFVSETHGTEMREQPSFAQDEGRSHSHNQHIACCPVAMREKTALRHQPRRSAKNARGGRLTFTIARRNLALASV